MRVCIFIVCFFFILYNFEFHHSLNEIKLYIFISQKNGNTTKTRGYAFNWPYLNEKIAIIVREFHVCVLRTHTFVRTSIFYLFIFCENITTITSPLSTTITSTSTITGTSLKKNQKKKHKCQNFIHC